MAILPNSNTAINADALISTDILTNHTDKVTPKLINGDIALNENGGIILVEGNEALKQWVEKIMHTAKDKHEIYDQYGCDIEDLVIGASFDRDFIENELKREITTALLSNELITSIDSFAYVYSGDTVINIVIRLNTVYNERMEVRV